MTSTTMDQIKNLMQMNKQREGEDIGASSGRQGGAITRAVHCRGGRGSGVHVCSMSGQAGASGVLL